MAVTYNIVDAYKHFDDQNHLISIEFIARVTNGADSEDEAVVLTGAALQAVIGNMALLKNIAETACAHAERRLDVSLSKKVAVDTSGVTLSATNIETIKASLP